LKVKFYVDKGGNYLGLFVGAAPPVGAVEVPKAPKTARDIWQGGQWVDAEPEAVEVVNMAQARLALFEAGHLSKVDPIIDAMPEPQQSMARIEWEYRPTVVKTSLLTQTLAAEIPLTAEQVTQLFNRADQL
jgi:hypothetical protein